MIRRKSPGDALHGGIPGHALARVAPARAHRRIMQPCRAGVHRVQQRTPLGTKQPPVRRVGLVAAQFHTAIGMFENLDAATDTAVGAGRLENLRCGIHGFWCLLLQVIGRGRQVRT